MANIGVPLELDQLVLTRGRDFKWTWTNLDDATPPNPIDFPAGQLFFELSTHGEENSRSHIDMTGANGGSYVISQDVTAGPTLPFDASEAVVRQTLEDMPGIGKGNVSVLGTYTPQWIFECQWNSAMSLSAGIVELFNATVTAAFEALDFMTGGLGVWLSGHYETNVFIWQLTYKGSLLEQEIVNFAAGVVADVVAAINTALTGVEQFTGEIANLSMIYAPIRHFDIEYINEMGMTPIKPLSVTSSLSGIEPSLTVFQDAKGQAPYTVWPFEIEGPNANITVEAADADAINDRTRWQLVFLADGTAESTDPLPKGTEGGDAIARGTVRVQAPR